MKFPICYVFSSEMLCGLKNIYILIRIIVSQDVTQQIYYRKSFNSVYPLRAKCFKYLCWKMRSEFHGFFNSIRVSFLLPSDCSKEFHSFLEHRKDRERNKLLLFPLGGKKMDAHPRVCSLLVPVATFFGKGETKR